MGRGKKIFLAAVFALCWAGTVAAAPLLKIGAQGHDVRVVQEALQRAGYAIEGVTGIFDEGTREAVLAFQRDQQLTESGTVDRATWHALRRRPPTPPSDSSPEQASPASKPPAKAEPPAASSGEAEPAAKTKEPKPVKEKEKKPEKKEPAPPAAEKVPESAAFLPRKEVPKLIATAKKYLGTPYRFGGTTPKGFDCSGFVQFVFRRHGFAIPRAADEQYKLGQRIKKRQELEPGDLVFFTTYEKGASHCGIYLGKNQFIHVSSRRGVHVDNLDDEYWKPRWYGGKHIVK